MENKVLKLSPSSYLYFFVIGAFFIVTGHLMFAKYMFMDGLYYTTIARNIAVGDGTVWDMKFTNTFFTHFHEHPPLAMWLESLYFKVLGNSWFVDKFYSVNTYVFTAFFIRKIWKVIFPDSPLTWVVLLFWLFTPVVFWAVGNNMLENTLSIFMMISVYYSLKCIITNKWYFSVLAGFFIAMGFFTKGFVAFYPLSFFVIYFLVFKTYTFKRMLMHSFLLCVGVVVPLLLLFVLNESAYLSIKAYVNIQVVNSLKNIVTVDSRLFIVKRLFSELLVSFSLLLLLFFSTLKEKFQISKNRIEFKWFLFFILFGLTGVLPIIVSLKQSGFYILTVYPLFSIGLVSLFKDRWTYFHEKIVGSRITKYVSTTIFLLGLIMVFSSISSYGKDEKVVKDIEVICRYLKKGDVIDSPISMSDDFSIHAYFYRINFISIRSTTDIQNMFYVVNLDENTMNEIPKSYRRVPLNTRKLKLYKKQ